MSLLSLVLQALWAGAASSNPPTGAAGGAPALQPGTTSAAVAACGGGGEARVRAWHADVDVHLYITSAVRGQLFPVDADNNMCSVET